MQEKVIILSHGSAARAKSPRGLTVILPIAPEKVSGDDINNKQEGAVNVPQSYKILTFQICTSRKGFPFEAVGPGPWIYFCKVLKFSTRKILMHVFIAAITLKLH